MGDAVGSDHAKAAVDPVTAAGQELKKPPCFFLIGGLGQHPPAASDHGVGAEDKVIGKVFRHLARFGGGQPLAKRRR
jgi:hypothetical protein